MNKFNTKERHVFKAMAFYSSPKNKFNLKKFLSLFTVLYYNTLRDRYLELQQRSKAYIEKQFLTPVQKLLFLNQIIILY